jgi:phosphonoacetate hydrolase
VCCSAETPDRATLADNGIEGVIGMVGMDRPDDLIIVSAKAAVVGTCEASHELSALDAPLRSHGGVAEQTVPLILNRRIEGLGGQWRLRNCDAFDLAPDHAGVDSTAPSAKSERHKALPA